MLGPCKSLRRNGLLPPWSLRFGCHEKLEVRATGMSSAVWEKAGGNVSRFVSAEDLARVVDTRFQLASLSLKALKGGWFWFLEERAGPARAWWLCC
jgi:hypothetical protein